MKMYGFYVKMYGNVRISWKNLRIKARVESEVAGFLGIFTLASLIFFSQRK